MPSPPRSWIRRPTAPPCRREISMRGPKSRMSRPRSCFWLRPKTLSPAERSSRFTEPPKSRGMRAHRGRIKAGVAMAEQIFLHLAHGIARQLVNEDHAFRQFELCQSGLERIEDRLLGNCRLGLRDNN